MAWPLRRDLKRQVLKSSDHNDRDFRIDGITDTLHQEHLARHVSTETTGVTRLVHVFVPVTEIIRLTDC